MTGVFVIFGVIIYYSQDLPDHETLANYKPAAVTRIYAGDGRLIEEYAKEKRFFVPIENIPKKITHAFISAEDKNFYSHPGVDFMSVFRAILTNLKNRGKGKSLVGGSTITQQVVKNLLLSNEKSIERKIKEAILAFRISSAFSKDKIMELYLNEIYLGNRSYGVAAAAVSYFNKSIDNLSIEEAAMLAALPKAPSQLDPRRNYDKAVIRRNWVIERMLEEGYITLDEAKQAKENKIDIANKDDSEIVKNANSFAEAVRQKLLDLYSEDKVYKGGLTVKTTIDPVFARICNQSFKKRFDRI